MGGYIVRRVLLMGLTLWFVSLMAFSVIRIVPGDTITALLTDSGLGSPEQLAAARAELGLDRPFIEQYASWLQGMLTGNFGDSLVRREATLADVGRALPVTLQLAVMAIVLSVLIGVPLGVLAATNRGRLIDRGSQLMGSVGMAVPEFFIGTVLVIYMAKYLGYQAPLGFRPIWEDPITSLNQVWLPASLMALRMSAVTMRMTRSVMVEVLTQDYVRTARAKGLSRFSVVAVHSLRNALLPVITIVGGQLGWLLGGALVMESLFSLPGMGTSTITAINRRDYSQLQTNVLVIAAVVVVVNLIVDLAYAALDPRVRLR